jgi:uncharacterized cupin superfamily protein
MSIAKLVVFDTHEAEYDEYLTDEAKCLRGRPLQRTWHHFTSADGRFFAGLWEAEPGCWTVRYTENEFCRILSGRSVLRDEAGEERSFQAGDSFVIPAGFAGEWEVLETTRKIYVIYQP